MHRQAGPNMVIDMVMFIDYNRSMINLNINEIKAHFSSYLVKAEKGERVVICRRNKPVAEIRPIKKTVRKKRPVGLARKEYPAFSIDRDFFEPLPENIVDAFTGGGK